MYTNLSASQRKLIKSLAQASTRREHRLFVAEGWRCVSQLLSDGVKLRTLVATSAWLDSNSPDVEATVLKATADDIRRMSSLQSPQPVIGVFEMPESEFSPNAIQGKLSIALDRVQDPGNLGTIVRIANWFGITHIICSHDTVDIYNPKVVQATMGALAKVNVCYTDLPSALKELSATMPVYGLALDGESIYRAPLDASGVIVMGNEGNGLSPQVRATLTNTLLIPPFPEDAHAVESLNVAVATAITVAEFRRRSLQI